MFDFQKNFSVLKTFLSDGCGRAILSHPRLKKLLDDEAFQHAVKDKNFMKLLSHPEFMCLVEDPEFRRLIEKFKENRRSSVEGCS